MDNRVNHGSKSTVLLTLLVPYLLVSCNLGYMYDCRFNLEGTVFLIFNTRTDPKPANNMFIFSWSKLGLQITNGFVYIVVNQLNFSFPLFCVHYHTLPCKKDKGRLKFNWK